MKNAIETAIENAEKITAENEEILSDGAIKAPKKSPKKSTKKSPKKPLSHDENLILCRHLNCTLEELPRVRAAAIKEKKKIENENRLDPRNYYDMSLGSILRASRMAKTSYSETEYCQAVYQGLKNIQSGYLSLEVNSLLTVRLSKKTLLLKVYAIDQIDKIYSLSLIPEQGATPREKVKYGTNYTMDDLIESEIIPDYPPVEPEKVHTAKAPHSIYV